MANLTDNLEAYYKLEESSGSATDETANNNDGTFNGNLPTQVAGVIGNAQDLNSANPDYITLPSFSQFSAFTISFWIRTSAYDETVVYFGANNDLQFTVQADADGGGLYIGLYDGSSLNKVTGSDISDGSWHHIVGTWDGSTLELYIDGVSQGTASANSMSSKNENDVIGTNSDLSTNPFDGRIDETGIWSRELSTQEARALYNNGKALKMFPDMSGWSGYDTITSDNTKVDEATDDLYVDLSNLSSGFWSAVDSGGADVRLTDGNGNALLPVELEAFDSGNDTGALFGRFAGIETGSNVSYRIYAGNGSASAPAATDPEGSEQVWESDYKLVNHMENTNDSTANSNDGTTNGGMTMGGVSGAFGDSKATYLDGSDDYINIPDSNSLSGFSALTLMYWLKFPATSELNGHIAKYSSGNKEWYIGWNNNQPYEIFITYDESSGGYMSVYDNANYEDNNWHLTGLTWDGTGNYTNITMWLDGATGIEDGGQNSGTFSGVENLGADLTIGHMPWGNYTEATFDEIRLIEGSKSNNWYTTHYNNQSDNANFWTVTSNFGQSVTVTGSINSATFSTQSGSMQGVANLSADVQTATFNFQNGIISADSNIGADVLTGTFSVLNGTVSTGVTVDVTGSVNTATLGLVSGSTSGIANITGTTSDATFNIISGAASIPKTVDANVQTLTFNQQSGSIVGNAIAVGSVNNATFNLVSGTTSAKAIVSADVHTLTFNQQNGSIIGIANVDGTVNTGTFNMLSGSVIHSITVNASVLTATFNFQDGIISAVANVAGIVNSATFSLVDGSAKVPAGIYSPYSNVNSNIPYSSVDKEVNKPKSN